MRMYSAIAHYILTSEISNRYKADVSGVSVEIHKDIKGDNIVYADTIISCDIPKDTVTPGEDECSLHFVTIKSNTEVALL